MSMIDVKGRGLREPHVSVVPSADGVRIRIDDDGRPEFWCEITLTEERLTTLVSLVTMCRREREQIFSAEGLPNLVELPHDVSRNPFRLPDLGELPDAPKEGGGS